MNTERARVLAESQQTPETYEAAIELFKRMMVELVTKVVGVAVSPEAEKLVKADIRALLPRDVLIENETAFIMDTLGDAEVERLITFYQSEDHKLAQRYHREIATKREAAIQARMAVIGETIVQRMVLAMLAGSSDVELPHDGNPEKGAMN